MRRLLIIVLLLVQCVCMTLTISSWWARRNNHLFGNGHWLIGKNLGKYVFYTFEFMFASQDERGVNLARDQGFQEILYHLPEDETRRLRSLAFDTAFEGGTYLWIILQKEENGGLCARFSRNERYPEGFFEFDKRGALVRHQPFEKTVAPEERWSRIRVERTDEGLSVYRNDIAVGHVQTPSPPRGHFGFRGSGRARTAVYVNNVEMVFEDPGRPTKTWKVHEDFDRLTVRRELLLAGVFIALLVMGLRLCRAALLCGYLARDRRAAFFLADLAGFTVASVVVFSLSGSTSGLKIPLGVVAAELWTVLMLRIARRNAVVPEPSRRWAPIFVTLCLTILAAAVHRHGAWLGRSTRNVAARMERVDPLAYILVPDPDLPAGPYTLDRPRDLRPGQAFFVEAAAYREQAVTLTFTMAEPCTLDVVLQQQAYRTHGDPQGEEIPLQRRLVRFSTVPKVAGGVAGDTHRNPMPIYPLKGTLLKNATNTVRITSTQEGLRVDLNGEVTSFPSFLPLGYGETGCMVYEEGARLHTFTVEALDAGQLRERALPTALLLGSLGAVVFLGLLYVGLARLPLADFPPLAGSALLMPTFYAGATLVMPPETLAYMGITRFLWLDVTAIGTSIALLIPLAARGLPRAAPVVFNLVFVALLGSVLLLVWDDLPAEHSLKLRYSSAATAPAGGVAPRSTKGPWYNSSRGIGANSYVWKQRFGPKTIETDKPDGVVRVFAVGGSQAWGSGAASSFETYDALLEKRLQAKGLPVEIYNAGINGAGTGSVLRFYEQVLSQFQPDILIVDVGLNDSAAIRLVRGDEAKAEFRERIIKEFRSLAEQCREQGVDLLLAQEAMSRESPLRPDDALYKAFAAEAQALGFPVLDAVPRVWEQETRHMVWWDPAHYAPYGHELLADLIQPQLELLVSARADRP